MVFLSVVGTAEAPDSTSYRAITQNILASGAFSLDGTSPTIRRPPTYPCFLAVIMTFAALSTWTIALVQCVIDSVAALLLRRVARSAVPPRAATGVAVVYAIFPGAITAACTVLSESLFTFFLVARMALICHGLDRERVFYFAAEGAVFGFAALCRSIGLIYPIEFAAVLVYLARGKRVGTGMRAS